MTDIKINAKDEIIMKILHYFITEEDYKPVILRGVNNEIWLENFEKDVKLIRININYIHNNEQFAVDLRRTNAIMKNIKRKTLSFNINMLNILIDASDYVKIEDDKNIKTVLVNKITDFKKNEFVKKLFPNISDKVYSKKSTEETFFKMTEEMNNKTMKEEKKMARIFKEKKPIVTYSLIAINVVFGFIMISPIFYDLFIAYGASYYKAVQAGEIYRLLISAFLHGGLIHLGFNMYALYIIGPQIERFYGRWKFLFIYLMSAVLGGLFSCVLNNSYSVGASAAIFGLFGSLVYFSYNYRASIDGFLKSQLLPVIFMNLLLGFMIPGIDVWAHVGGLIGGILCSMIVGLTDKTKKTDKINGIIVLAIITIFLSYMLYIK